VKIPGWATAAGRRTLVPAEVFGAGEKHVFDSANRVHPIYFSYGYIDTDDLTITPASGWQVSNVPTPQTADLKAVFYNLTRTAPCM
jgi:hypothetical protein